MTPSTKEALAADATLKAYNEAHPAPRIIDPTATTDLSNAKRFVQLHQRNIRYVPVWKCWMVWDGSRWREKEDRQMVQYVEEMIKEIQREAVSVTSKDTQDKLLKHANSTESEARIMACIRLASGQAEIIASPEDFDNHRFLLNAQNGTIELRSGKLREFRREDMLTQTLNAPYDPEAKQEDWLAFLKRIMAGDEVMISFLQRAVGYALTGNTSEECIFMLHGTGANGKSKFIDAIAFMLGEYARKTAIHTIMETKNESALSPDIAVLKGVRFAYASEPNKGKRLDEGKIKDVSGGERISCCRKFCEPEEYLPQFKLFISFNHKPVIKSADKGLQRRIRFIPFDVRIPDNEQDKQLDQKLHAEAAGILTWAIQGCLKWQDEGLGFPEKARIATETYFDEMDVIGEFLDDACLLGGDFWVPFQELYEIYIKWCEYIHTLAMTAKSFSQSLNERDLISDKYKGIRIKRGLKFKDELESVQSAVRCGMLVFKFRTDVDRKTLFNTPIEKATHIGDNLSGVSNPSLDIDIDKNINLSNLSNLSIISLIKDKLKQKYDKLNKPDSIQDLERLKINMRNEIILWLSETLPENQEIPGNEFIDRIITDYCKARQWA